MVLIFGGTVDAKWNDIYNLKIKATWVIGTATSDILVQKVAFLDNFERIF